MRAYRFSVGETVLVTEHRAHVRWKAEYRVLRHLDTDDLEQRYQIRSTNRSHERVAREHELSARA